MFKAHCIESQKLILKILLKKRPQKNIKISVYRHIFLYSGCQQVTRIQNDTSSALVNSFVAKKKSVAMSLPDILFLFTRFWIAFSN